MADSDLVLPEGWDPGRGKAASLSKRFSFEGYGKTRDFLDQVAELSEQDEYHPNISFGTTYANITIDARNGEKLDQADVTFALEVDRLYGENS
ncbi:MAG TPA: 4a-hydroxytetrahydrobiopterin dehydratase [Thioalkalivibrio sp.]|nr:4a-hydroxytetrahydrobiopterin dehydratase [Thioalkalivibrio sp.]